MSTPSGSPSPLQVAANSFVDETKMPKGHCRYILLLPEIKGQRCACVGFSLNKGIPGASCDCGHLACFHNKEPEVATDSKQELELLKKRIQQLEDQMTRGQDGVTETLVSRINEMEEHLEKSKEEFSEQIKGTYRNITISWRSIEQAEQKSKQQDEQLRQIYEKLRDHNEQLERLDAGQLELRDADLSLEERIENITEILEEEEERRRSSPARRPRRRSTSDTSRPNLPLGQGAVPSDDYRRPFPPTAGPRNPGHGEGLERGGTTAFQLMKPLPVSARSTGPWTVHISLLPHAGVPMPFERNTNAYQRCLSRGLHRMVAVHGPDAESFNRAVEEAFGSFLKGREWMPLQAKLCDAETLQGLPMLRQLDPQLIDPKKYDQDFLRHQCGVCDSNGIIDSLYIAMKSHTISWHTLRHSPVFMAGLESCWAYDALLDRDQYDGDMAIDDEDRPAAGDITTILPPIQPSLKRPLTEMSRSNSFSAGAAEGEDTRKKRACPVPPPPGTIVEIRRRGVGAA
ncbi:uncharacterized protein QC763_202570 [Podospora pseudopauciseta]|uniref:GDP/GTP exchange factor Sec2 N-terminal domain-containing protein n=1 Tax=Podospora pseudopauciseta TaxID=2093780 RepID=A0ABR0HN64_9PEZI|nr:hypothetical protein QC763_202570 [Podospora pseudopauciseta]